jgi:O-acetylserine/cysteine efflux transporter
MSATVGYLLVPVVGLASAAIVLGEPVTALDVLGFGLTLGGIAALSVATPVVAPPMRRRSTRRAAVDDVRGPAALDALDDAR